MYKVYYAQFNLKTGHLEEGSHCSGLDGGEYVEVGDNEIIWSETPDSPTRARELIRQKVSHLMDLFDEAHQKLYWEHGI